MDDSKHRAALVILIEAKGSTPRKEGSKMIVFEDKSIQGTIGGGNLEMQVIEDALEVINSQKSKIYDHHLVKDHQMCCGGSVKIYIEPYKKTDKLFLFGAGHISKEVVKSASGLNFEIHVIDERKTILEQFNVSNTFCHAMSHKVLLPQMSFDRNTFIIICTHLHHYDREILAYCIKKDFAYLGMIGSKRKVAVVHKLFIKNQLADNKELEKVDMPIGFDIGAQTPAEIAISILAKIIAIRHQKFQSSEDAASYRHFSTFNLKIDGEENCYSNRSW